MLTLYCMTHKVVEDNRIPKDRTMMLVGSYNKDINRPDYVKDNVGDNISTLNSSFCELTGLYSIWKNDNQSEYVGLEHYRRLFSNRKMNLFGYKVLSKKTISKYLENADIILPVKHCWPHETNLIDQYRHEQIASDIDLLEQLINEEYKDYVESFNKVMYNNNWAYNYNMFVCKKSLIDEYCEFLFDVLFKLKDRININDGRDNYQARVFGFLSERLFNVWIAYKGNLKIKELEVATLGDKPLYDTKRRIYRHFKWHNARKELKKR